MKQPIEKTLLIICGLALLVELLDIWWSAYVFLISFSSLAYQYVLFSTLSANEKISFRNILNICKLQNIAKSFFEFMGALCLAFMVIGVMAKIQLFYWANEGLKMSIIFGCILLIISLIKKNRWLTSRLAFYLGLASILYLLPFERIIEFKYRNHPEYKKEVYENFKRDLKK